MATQCTLHYSFALYLYSAFSITHQGQFGGIYHPGMRNRGDGDRTADPVQPPEVVFGIAGYTDHVSYLIKHRYTLKNISLQWWSRI